MIGFERFLELIPGSKGDPYPWQRRFAARCLDGALPKVIALPTGAGKTTTVDVLVWALANQAQRPAAERTVGVRIVWAIDRRILVDEVHSHACALAERLAAAKRDSDDPLHEIAQSLSELSRGGASPDDSSPDVPPLVATRWRGGLDRRPERYGPLQPQIITSTVAQIGSRLLFRGYGVGERSLALEAGLAACDTTICLDEAHLAEPFRQTVEGVRRLQRARHSPIVLPGLDVITVTATPQRDERGGGDGTATDQAMAETIGLGEDDRIALGSRWSGKKEAVLVEPASSRDADCVAALTTATLAHLDEGALTVACIANTVKRAREVFAKLRAKVAEAQADVVLLIGPQRPADRERILDPQRRAALFEWETPAKPLVVVATQTFEVGLDADVAAMVSESASAGSLVQRLGRLYRSGLPKHGVVAGRATIVRDEAGWLYRGDEPLAWEWLRKRQRPDGTIDVSVAALHEDDERPRPTRTVPAPGLTAEIAALFAQTSPRPYFWAEPDVEAFLRGAESEPSADVGVCWRSDLRPDRHGEGADGYRRMLLRLVPPHRSELLTLSVASARQLLVARFKQSPAAGRAALADADVEGETATVVPVVNDEATAERFLVMRHGDVLPGTLGDDEQDAISLRDIQPGDVIVLATKMGGVDEYGLAPDPLRRVSQATDVAPDLRLTQGVAPAQNGVRPDGSLLQASLVRVTFGALAECTNDRRLSKRQWQWVERQCRRTEQLHQDNGRADGNHIAELVAKLADRFPEHPGLGRLAQVDDPKRLVLRSVGPLDAEAVPELDEDERYGEPEEAGEEWSGESGEEPLADGGEEVRVDAEQREGEPTPTAAASRWGWVLMAIPAGHRDWADRPRTGPGSPPTLDAHATAVRKEAVGYVERLALPEAVRAAVELAARAHDHGKADRRVQAFYRSGVSALGAEPIAKSEFGERNPRVEALARDRAGLPRRLRHEIGSVKALKSHLESQPLLVAEADLELAYHLGGTHHGLGRPIPRVPVGGDPPQPFDVEADGIAGTAIGDGCDGWEEGAWLERFWNVVDRYGAWGVAYLEALLMSADRAVSSRGE